MNSLKNKKSITLKMFFLLVAISSLAFAKPILVNKDELGFIRKLKVYKYPQWTSKITTSKGKDLYFSSPKSMFELYLQFKGWPELEIKTIDDFVSVLVTDYKTYQAINARTAFYVYGSNVTSISGDDLIPFKNEYDAKEYAKNHNGKRIFRFSQVKYQLIELINGTL